MKEVLYQDLSLKFEKHPVTKRVKTLTNEEAITQAVKNLVFTNQHEVLFNPDHYTNIEATLFENVTPITLTLLQQRIEVAIRNYEPRAEVIRVDVTSNIDDNVVEVEIHYVPVIGLDPIKVTIFLERIR